MASVSLRGVSKTYAGRYVVKRLDLEVADRELVVLVGPSGCGKTTTLRLIAGLEDPDEGEIWIDGRPVNGISPAGRDVSMMFQSYALYPHLSVYKNMALGLELRYGRGWLRRLTGRLFRSGREASVRQDREQIRSQVLLAARVLGIESLLERKPRQLSGGERQRVALGRAIVRRPAAFLFDEPLSNLDARTRIELRREIRRIHERREAATIYVTHDQREAMTLGDRIAVMDSGELHQVGTPEEVYRRPRNRFVAGFLGSPPMNFATLRIKCGEMAGADGTWRSRPRIAWPPDGSVEQAVLGVRPEHISLRATGESAENSHAESSDAECSDAEDSPDDVCWEGRVERIENLGDVVLAHVSLDGGRATDGRATDGRATDGRATDGRATDGRATDGGATDGGREVWICRITDAERPDSGGRVTLKWKAGCEHWFDVDSGVNLACRRDVEDESSRRDRANGKQN